MTDIVETVAESVGTDPCQLWPPLYDVVDAEAIEALCAHADDRSIPGSVTFRWCGRLVQVSFDGEVSVDSRSGRPGDGF